MNIERSGTIFKTVSGKTGIVWHDQEPVNINGGIKYCMYLVDEIYNETGSHVLVDISLCEKIGNVN